MDHPTLIPLIEDVTALGCSGAGNGEINFFHFIFFRRLQDGFPAARNGDAVDIAVPFAGIVIDKADYALVYFAGPADVAQDHPARRPGSDEHDAGCRPVL